MVGTNKFRLVRASLVKCPKVPISNVTKVTTLPLSSKSKIRGAYFFSFLFCASVKPEGELRQIVSSKMDISASETNTRSGLSEVVEMFGGIVEGGLVLANLPGRSA